MPGTLPADLLSCRDGLALRRNGHYSNRRNSFGKRTLINNNVTSPTGSRVPGKERMRTPEYAAVQGMYHISAVRTQLITMGSESRVAGTQEFTTRPELAGTFGMVASTHWLASAAGMAVLEAGGNAFDAAVATGLVLQVVEPHLNGPGGEVPIIGYSAGDGGEFVIDGQGVAPAAATLEVFSALGIDLVPGNGLLAAMVPGAFGAWMLLLERYGTLQAPRRHALRDRLRRRRLPDAARGERCDRRHG